MSIGAELQRGVSQLKISLSFDIQDKLLRYLALLQKWNKVYNLTAIDDPKIMVSNHLLDSLAVIPHIWPKNWVDVGCGAGLPGLVLAIALPDWQFSLLDSNSKKTSFVQQAIIELELHNAQVFCTRVETWKPAERFDGVISRAYTDLGNFLRNTRHLAVRNGRWAAMKGAPEKELYQVPDDFRVDKIIPLQVPGIGAARSLVIASCKEKQAT